jgi:hypothetical protein
MTGIDASTDTPLGSVMATWVVTVGKRPEFFTFSV